MSALAVGVRLVPRRWRCRQVMWSLGVCDRLRWHRGDCAALNDPQQEG